MKSNNPNTELQMELVVMHGGRKPAHCFTRSKFQKPLEFQPSQPEFRQKDFIPNFSEIFWVLKLRFLAFSQGPGGFREVWEAGRNHFHLSRYLLVPRITSYSPCTQLEIHHRNSASIISHTN